MRVDGAGNLQRQTPIMGNARDMPFAVQNTRFLLDKPPNLLRFPSPLAALCRHFPLDGLITMIVNCSWVSGSRFRAHSPDSFGFVAIFPVFYLVEGTGVRFCYFPETDSVVP